MKHLFNNDSFSDQQGNHPAGVPFSCISQNLKESSCQYRRRMVDTKVYHHGEFLLLLYDYYIYFNLFCKGFFCYEDIYSMF